MSYGKMNIPTSNKYLRVESGKPIDIHIITASENIKTKKVYYDGSKYHEILDGDAVPTDMEGKPYRVETRFAIQVLDRADRELKWFEFGPNIAIGIREVAKVLEMDGQSIHDVDLRISRVSEKPVRYSVVQRKKAGDVPQEILDEVAPF